MPARRSLSLCLGLFVALAGSSALTASCGEYTVIIRDETTPRDGGPDDSLDESADAGVDDLASLADAEVFEGGPAPLPPWRTTRGTAVFTYSYARRVYRVEARVGAPIEDVSAEIEPFGRGTMDRWIVPSHNAAFLVLATERAPCPEVGECLAIMPRDLSRLEPVLAGGAEVAIVGTPAVNDLGDAIVYPATGGPHGVDLWLTRRRTSGWTAPALLTATSTAPFNNMPALTFDESRVLFDCGRNPYPETGDNDSCEVRLDGTGFRVVVTPTSMTGNRSTFTQFAHESADGVLVQGAWSIGTYQPETIWLLPWGGPPLVAIGRNLTNAVSPCGLPDGRFGALWLTRPDAPASKHELTLMERSGAIDGVLTPGIDVTDIGIGCGGR